MTVKIQREGAVLTLALDRPSAKNALDLPMVRALRAALVDPGRVVVLKSALRGYFSIGMDLVALDAGLRGGANTAEVYEAVREYVALLKDLVSLRVPVIAAVGGMAVGGGVDLVAACDLVIATESAAFSIAQLRKGVFPLTTSGVVIPRIGQREFLYWLLSGQNYSAKKVRKLGLVSQVVPDGELDARVAALVTKILAFPPDALQLGMDALRLAPELTQRERLDHLGALLTVNALERPL
jgi:enoyl-CoA hydratase/carnithine racemase